MVYEAVVGITVGGGAGGEEGDDLEGGGKIRLRNELGAAHQQLPHMCCRPGMEVMARLLLLFLIIGRPNHIPR